MCNLRMGGMVREGWDFGVGIWGRRGFGGGGGWRGW